VRAASANRDVERPLVLIAEDEAIIALELIDGLSDAGFAIAGPFSTCAEADAWLEIGAPDAAVVDNVLKDGPCDSLIRELSLRRIPTLIFSGREQHVAASADARAVWIPKPAAFPQLLTVLRREMTLRRSP
jgi:DNA-binding response OmpR family regulator